MTKFFSTTCDILGLEEVQEGLQKVPPVMLVKSPYFMA